MNNNRWLVSILLAVCTLPGINAWAHGPGGFHHHGWHGGRPGFSFYWGAPITTFGYPGYYGNYYYGPPAYYYPPSIVSVPASPPVYIEQTPMHSESRPSGYWYYCAQPEGYYPYIKACNTQWRQVAPAPTDAR